MEDGEIQNTDGIRGRFQDCFVHLFTGIENRAPKGTREAVALRRPIAEFCGVKEGSVVRWTRTDSGMVGEVRFRLMCYLQMIGYEVIEFVRSDSVVQSTIELIGFGVMSGKEVADEIGYTTTSSLFQVLHGRVGLSEEKKVVLWRVAKKCRDALEEAKKKAQATIKSTPSQQPDTVGQRQASKGEGSPPVGTSQGIIDIMAGLLILLEEGALTEDDCAALTSHGQRTILKLSGYLSRLSSNLVTSGTAQDR